MAARGSTNIDFSDVKPTEVANLHRHSDVNSSPLAQHHTLGIQPNQASPGDHTHDGIRSVFIDTVPTAAMVPFTPSGNIASGNVQTAIQELDTEKSSASHLHDGDYVNEIDHTLTQHTTLGLSPNSHNHDANYSAIGHVHAASVVTFTPVGSLAATEVQAALAELDTEKSATGHTHVSANITNFNTSTDDRINLKVPMQLFSGSGTPEGVVTAPMGSLYTSTAGGASTTLYVKTSGVGNTGWTAK